MTGRPGRSRSCPAMARATWSRGAHQRRDRPATESGWNHHHVVVAGRGAARIEQWL